MNFSNDSIFKSNSDALLYIVTLMNQNLRVRDRIVKIIQYGCQMLVGYYGSTLNEYNSKLANTRRNASNARFVS